MIYPKCENAERLYVTSSSQVRPCCWLGEKGNINQDKKWNLTNTIEDILGVQLKEFVKNLKENPKSGHRLLVINNVINLLLINQLRIGWSLKNEYRNVITFRKD